MEKTYVVRKLINGGVSYTLPGRMVARNWKGKDARMKISFEELQECVYDPAVRTLFDKGYLLIEDKAARIELGLEEDDRLIVDSAEAAKILYEDDFDTFVSKIERMVSGSVEILIAEATTNLKEIGYQKADYLRTKYFIDIEAIHRRLREENQQGG